MNHRRRNYCKEYILFYSWRTTWFFQAWSISTDWIISISSECSFALQMSSNTFASIKNSTRSCNLTSHTSSCGFSEFPLLELFSTQDRLVSTSHIKFYLMCWSLTLMFLWLALWVLVCANDRGLRFFPSSCFSLYLQCCKVDLSLACAFATD